jgi:hypothetical protein
MKTYWEWRYSSTSLDLGIRFWCVVCFTPCPLYHGWAPKTVWIACSREKYLSFYRESNRDRSASSTSLYRLSYDTHTVLLNFKPASLRMFWTWILFWCERPLALKQLKPTHSLTDHSLHFGSWAGPTIHHRKTNLHVAKWNVHAFELGWGRKVLLWTEQKTSGLYTRLEIQKT